MNLRIKGQRPTILGPVTRETEMDKGFRANCPRAQSGVREGVPRLGRSGYVRRHQTGTVPRRGRGGGAMGSSEGRHIGLAIGVLADEKIGESDGVREGELSASSSSERDCSREGKSTTDSCGLSSHSVSSSSDSPSESSRSNDMSTSSSKSNSLFMLASRSGDDGVVVVTKYEGV